MSGLMGGGSSSQSSQRFAIPPGGAVVAGTASSLPTEMPDTASRAAEEAANRIIEAEQQRSERDRIAAIQRQLGAETTSRSRGYGIRSLFGALGTGRRSYLGAG